MAELGATCTAYADADSGRYGNCHDRWRDAKGYTDYRRMFDAHEGEIDAVMVGTPDHHHYPATIIAMMLGKHVYTQKPLTHTVWEARQLALATEKYKVATQMGNQGHSLDSLRVTIDHLRSKTIGDLVEAHVWTNRPVWRQGMQRPDGAETVPQNLDWEAWIGPAPMRPFRHEPSDRWGGFYHPFNWRAFWDFGCGALGDMACHELDPVYWAMDPGYPISAELVDGEPFGDEDQYRSRGSVRFEFAAKGDRPGFAIIWHEGGNKPERPEELEPETEMAAEGALYIGTKGKLMAMPDARKAPRLLPKSRQEEAGDPPQQIERSEGHYKEWYRACTGDAPYDHPKSNFLYAGPFTETVLVGCIAQRIGGKLLFDGESQRITNHEGANALITKEYREGWNFRMS